MNVKELIRELEKFDDDAEVRVDTILSPYGEYACPDCNHHGIYVSSVDDGLTFFKKLRQCTRSGTMQSVVEEHEKQIALNDVKWGKFEYIE